uniref:Peroxisome biogenesis protein 3-1 n=1 Tax=Anthurium amnicola TaxID=1678845 RepID=A0A1D1XMM1_9ARAE
MSSLRGLWTRHRRRIFVSVGVLGAGYAVYRLYASHRQRVLELELQCEGKRRADELVKAQLQAHFLNIQRISDTTTLPYAMNFLRSRISEELDLSYLTEKLMQGKGQSNTLTPNEKVELWEKLKILSFTRTASSLWAMTMLCLYVRVQVNILGRHLYFEAARGFGSSQSQDEANPFDRHGEQEFLATADYLSSYGIGTLILKMQNAVTEVMREKQLRNPFNMIQLHEMMMQILNFFMSSEAPNSWLACLIPENASQYRQLVAMSSNGFEDSTMLMDVSKLEQLMVETRAVLSSSDFGHIMEMSLRRIVDGLIEDISVHIGGSPHSGVPLAKLLPRVAQSSPSLLEEPNKNKFVQIIRGLPEVELFFTLLYANTGS